MGLPGWLPASRRRYLATAKAMVGPSRHLNSETNLGKGTATAAAAAGAARGLRLGGSGKKIGLFVCFFCIFTRFEHFAAFLSVFGRFGTLLDVFLRFWSPVFLGPSTRSCR